MSVRHQLITAVFASGLALASMGGVAAAQSAPAKPHTITITLVQKNGGAAYAFEPAAITAVRGDTLRFVDGEDMMHNVHFTAEPKGAHLGSAEMGPYVTGKGQVYSLVIDARFAVGKYEFVCDPHQTIGMKGTLTVTSGPPVATN